MPLYGEWEDWVKQNLDFCERTARRYMEAANRSLTSDLDASYLPKLWGHESRLNGSAHVSYNSGENEWYTPPEFIASAREVLGTISLDPAIYGRFKTCAGARSSNTFPL